MISITFDIQGLTFAAVSAFVPHGDVMTFSLNEAAWESSSSSSALDLPIGMAETVVGLAALYAIMFES